MGASILAGKISPISILDQILLEGTNDGDWQAEMMADGLYVVEKYTMYQL